MTVFTAFSAVAADAGSEGAARSVRFATALGLYALAAGLVSFMGWVLDIQQLTAWGGSISIQPNTTLAASSAGAALVLLTRGHRRFVAGFGLVAGLIGLATLLEHVSGIDFGIDTLLTFGRPWVGTATVAPGRMGPPAATSWSLLGIGLLAALGGSRARQAAAGLGLTASAIAVLSLIGYIFGADPLYSVAPLTGIALQTSTMIIAVSVGLVAALPDRPPMRVLLERSAAGLLARRALPFILVLPVVLGLLLLRAETARVFDLGLGTALLVLSLIIMMSAGLWWCVAAVSSHERALAAATLALRESEQRFRAFADAAPAMLWVTAPDGSCTFRSRGWYEFTGQSELEALGFGWLDAVHPEDRAASRQSFLDAAAGHAPFTLEHRLRRVDGEYRWAISAGRPRFDAGGEFLGYSASVIDIHDRKRAEEQLRQAAKMEAIGRLAGGIAHDFNNKLSAVSGFVTFAARDPGLGARAQQDLQEVLKATEQMAGLTRQLLAFSRQQVLQPETLQLNAAVLDGLSLLQRLVGSHVEMSVDLTAEPTWIRVDRAQLLQVLMNLTINARDAMPSGGRLRIRTGRLEVTQRAPQGRGQDAVSPGTYVLLSVADTGTGIPGEHLSHIFEPFFTTKEVGQGTGLGLATVHGIVTQSQGYIRVESQPGEGSTFTVLFPAAPGGAAVRRAIPRSPDLVPRPARILVVDDEEMVRAVVSRTLQEEGYEVIQARNGKEALECLARDNAVDLVLTDVIMPELGGRKLGERLAAGFPDLPVIWMSGYPHDSAFGVMDTAGAASFLQKPISPEVLVRTVEGALARRPADAPR